MGEALIQLQQMDFTYPDGTAVLKGIDLEIGRGEFVALIGQNGAGKTTLAKCFNGLLKPTAGQVLVGGVDTRAKGAVKKLVTSVGYVFQNPDHQLFNGNVFDEIAYAPRNLGLSDDEVKERVHEAAGVAGVREDLFTQHPFFLPKGLRQRVAIASILALRPAAVVVDEPTTGQDYRQSVEIMEFLRRLNREGGHTIIIISHEMQIVARYAERTIALAKGRVLLDGPTRQVFAQADKLLETFVKPPQATEIALALGDLGVSPETLEPEELLPQ